MEANTANTTFLPHVPLSKRKRQLLDFLVKHHPDVVPYEKALTLFPSRAAFDMALHHLRSKLVGQDCTIVTHAGLGVALVVGYRMRPTLPKN